MSIEKNLNAILDRVYQAAQNCSRSPEEISILAVSKGRSLSEIQAAYWQGCRDFGENRIQEALEKMELLPSDIRWHFVGKIQKNKVNKLVGRFALIHSVDDLEIASKLSYASLQRGLVTPILLESNTSEEASKSGLPPHEWEKVFLEILDMQGIEVNGCMTMAPLTEDESRIRRCFAELRLLRERLQEMAGNRADLTTLSMGMSNDFDIAIQEGATLLRIGTAIFAST